MQRLCLLEHQWKSGTVFYLIKCTKKQQSQMYETKTLLDLTYDNFGLVKTKRNKMKRNKIVSQITIFLVSPNSVFVCSQITVQFSCFVNYSFDCFPKYRVFVSQNTVFVTSKITVLLVVQNTILLISQIFSFSKVQFCLFCSFCKI